MRGMEGLITPEDITKALGEGLNPLKGQVSFWFIFGNNLRALLIIAFLGLLSFGTLGILAYVLNTSLIGGVLGIFKVFGYSPLMLLLTGILPHGIFELPALIISSAAVMHIGVMLVTPEARRTLGETLIATIADWAKINLGLVIPLLAVAAAIETWITPVLLLSALK
jgi:stage II sporulation protein M